MTVRWGLRAALATTLVLGLGSCADDDEPAESDESTETAESESESESDEHAGIDAVSDELIEMGEADQAERTGTSVEWHDEERAERLQEIIDEHGWPTIDLVGDEAASAAWLIAQHADFDVEFQDEALALMQEAAEGQVDETEVAYLEDRVAVNRGEPQTYGTQMQCVDGVAVPRTLVDAATVDQSRAEVGLDPLADYLAEFEC